MHKGQSELYTVMVVLKSQSGVSEKRGKNKNLVRKIQNKHFNVLLEVVYTIWLY